VTAAAAAAPSLHIPGSYAEVAVLAGATVASVVAGRLSVGRGYGVATACLALVAFGIIGNTAIPVAAALVGAAFVVRRRQFGIACERPTEELLWQVAIVLGGLALYTLGRYVVEAGGTAPFSNTDRVIDLERSVGLYVEADIQELVLRSNTLTRATNWFYSYGFLAIVAASLLWLWVVDEENYRLLRNALGISALLAVPTIALFPVAPPRLVADSGMVDTIVLFGREHAFANEYAAIPSLHVGWLAAAGVVLGRSVGGVRGIALAALFGPVMLFVVIATGNHFWFDGLVGVLYAVGPVAVLTRSGRLPRFAVWPLARIQRIPTVVLDGASTTWVTLGENRRALFSFLSLGGLLAYLLIAQRLTPGFTDFWGYLVGQVAVFVVLLVAGEIVFARQGGMSWLTHVVAVICAYADVLGTDGNLYAAIDEYDKFTHLAGVAAFTAGIYDVLSALYRRRTVRLDATDRLLLSITVGVAIGIGWEVYEFVGDRLFDSTRVNGRWDTANDIVSDAAGAVIVGLLLWWWEVRRADTAAVFERERISAGAGD
jgi:hypothetical protein